MASLELTSLSSLSLKRANDSFDLVFDLSSQPLPAFSVVDCWRGRSISPLRDRTMIGWLFSHRQTESHLKSITSLINKTLKERIASSLSSTKEQSTLAEMVPPSKTTLLVGVACQNGAQHSVCFIERLYEKYSFECPPELKGGVKLSVKRMHCEATKGEWINTKEPVWQHSKIASKHLINHKDLLLNRSWLSFQDDVGLQIEAAFCKDSFTTKVDVGKHIVDFDRGIVYNKRSREEFRIRSAIPKLEGKVKSSWLQERGKKEFFCGAGILFYSVHPRTGEPVFLLGHMTYSCMSWCDFGGMKDYGEQSRCTAARESYEETLGVLGQTDDLLTLLENFKENNVFEITNRNTKYVGHYLRVPYKDYPAEFDKVLKKKSGRKEVNEIRWFSLSCLRSGIQKSLLDQYDLKVQPLNKDGSVATSQRLPLRSEFVHSLCIAEQLGVLKSIEHIAKTLHTRSRGAPLSLSLHQQLEGTESTKDAAESTEVCSTDDRPPTKVDDQLVEVRLHDDFYAEEERGKGDEEETIQHLEKLKLSPKRPEDSENKPDSRTEAAATLCSVATNSTSVISILSKNTTIIRLYGVGTGTFLTY